MIVLSRYLTEVVDIDCPQCGAENRISAESYEPWECGECGFEPEWNTQSRDEWYCDWCGKDITEIAGKEVLTKCKDCMRVSQKLQKIRSKQCCPHCDERLTADDLREIKEARREAKKTGADSSE